MANVLRALAVCHNEPEPLGAMPWPWEERFHVRVEGGKPKQATRRMWSGARSCPGVTKEPSAAPSTAGPQQLGFLAPSLVPRGHPGSLTKWG